MNIWKEEKKHFANCYNGRPVCGTSGNKIRKTETTKSGVTCERCLKILGLKK